MIHADAATRDNDRAPFAVRWMDAGQATQKTEPRHRESIRGAAVHELNVTGSQLLLGWIGSALALGIVWWTVLKLWLFKP